jgi:hypothetical protein
VNQTFQVQSRGTDLDSQIRQSIQISFPKTDQAVFRLLKSGDQALKILKAALSALAQESALILDLRDSGVKQDQILAILGGRGGQHRNLFADDGLLQALKKMRVCRDPEGASRKTDQKAWVVGTDANQCSSEDTCHSITGALIKKIAEQLGNDGSKVSKEPECKIDAAACIKPPETQALTEKPLTALDFLDIKDDTRGVTITVNPVAQNCHRKLICDYLCSSFQDKQIALVLSNLDEPRDVQNIFAALLTRKLYSCPIACVHLTQAQERISSQFPPNNFGYEVTILNEAE